MNSLHDSLHDFLPCFSVMTFYQSQTIFMFFLHVSRHDSLSDDLHVSLYVSHHDSLSNDLHVSLYVSRYDSLSNDLHVFSSWLSIKKIMQKDNVKVEKISIFSSLDVKLKFLTSRVELTQFLVESSCIKLKIWATWLKLSWKCEQLNSILIQVQNVNLKLNLTISLSTEKNSILICVFLSSVLNSIELMSYTYNAEFQWYHL